MLAEGMILARFVFTTFPTGMAHPCQPHIQFESNLVDTFALFCRHISKLNVTRKFFTSSDIYHQKPRQEHLEN
jgi:hypothetical protein